VIDDDVPDTIEYTKEQLYKAAGFTSLFFIVPVGIMVNQRAFNAFNGFHSRLFKLDKRSPAGLAGIAFVASMGYSALLMPLYYKGICSIFNLQGFGQIRRIMNKKVTKMLEEDERLGFIRGRIEATIDEDEKDKKA
jgi:hypothetical protein